jgi:AraC-like DNA-binding protein/mannose-6-phosphate isomerase-like protein (cupin superfamily)
VEISGGNMNFSQHWYISDISDVFQFTRAASETPEESTADYSVLCYCVSGNVEINCGGERYFVHPGNICYFPPSLAHSILSIKENCFIAIHFCTNVPLSEHIEVFQLHTAKSPYRDFVNLLSTYNSNDTGYLSKSFSMFYSLMAHLEKHLASEAYDFNFPHTLRRALTCIHANYTNSDFNVDSLATALNCSGTYIRRLFSVHLRTSPRNYIRVLRIQYATDLLSSGYYSISNVAHMCGYADQKNFSTAYKTVTGESPSIVKSTTNPKSKKKRKKEVRTVETARDPDIV